MDRFAVERDRVAIRVRRFSKSRNRSIDRHSTGSDQIFGGTAGCHARRRENLLKPLSARAGSRHCRHWDSGGLVGLADELDVFQRNPSFR